MKKTKCHHICFEFPVWSAEISDFWKENHFESDWTKFGIKFSRISWT